jgi:hypothetical protein
MTTPVHIFGLICKMNAGLERFRHGLQAAIPASFPQNLWTVGFNQQMKPPCILHRSRT